MKAFLIALSLVMVTAVSYATPAEWIRDQWLKLNGYTLMKLSAGEKRLIGDHFVYCVESFAHNPLQPEMGSVVLYLTGTPYYQGSNVLFCGTRSDRSVKIEGTRDSALVNAVSEPVL